MSRESNDPEGRLLAGNAADFMPEVTTPRAPLGGDPLPCPFCGSEPKMYPSGNVGCSAETCGLYLSSFSTPWWNRRASGLPGAGLPAKTNTCGFCGAFQVGGAPFPANATMTQKLCEYAAGSVERLQIYFATRGPLVLMGNEARGLADRCKEILDRLHEGGDDAPTSAQLNLIHDAALSVREERAPTVLTEIGAERERQKGIGWTPAHDDEHTTGDLAKAACAFVSSALGCPMTCEGDPLEMWKSHRKDRTPREKLVRAAALLVAEIERHDRAGEGL